NMNVIQYRGRILPLINVISALPERRVRKRDENQDTDDQSKNTIQVIVYSNNDNNVGIVVDSIIDIVEEVFEMQSAGCREGVLGTAVIQKRIIEIIDVEKIICAAGIPVFKRSEA
ncbi:MAG TPA: chemotaxis protein CheW, partial [Candidatus Wallbacteria bacterium]|nr:chemotaxis protein CheW [Candidatus Wallbacteria bacterium]